MKLTRYANTYAINDAQAKDLYRIKAYAVMMLLLVFAIVYMVRWQ
ncbi:MAG: hypothetical protein ACR2JE_14165 [Acidobacteriaceae bacterium]